MVCFRRSLTEKYIHYSHKGGISMAQHAIKKTVYFVRHGQSEGNISAAFQAPSSPLSEKGLRQAEQIAHRVSQLSFDALISSPFDRAKETAEVIARVTGKTTEFSNLFSERIKPTSIDGKPHEDQDAVVIWKEWNTSLYVPGMKVEDGENFDDLVVRSERALSFLEHHPARNIVVVTHGYFLRTIVARVLLDDLFSPETFKNFQKMASMENTGLTVLRYHDAFEEDPCWHLWIYNDHAHLAE